uniref:Uncharacterized protein n=1 Tax=Steinernema glaseri TaxID=37863 RepID=A0A1I7XZF3_9BILA
MKLSKCTCGVLSALHNSHIAAVRSTPNSTSPLGLELVETSTQCIDSVTVPLGGRAFLFTECTSNAMIIGGASFPIEFHALRGALSIRDRACTRRTGHRRERIQQVTVEYTCRRGGSDGEGLRQAAQCARPRRQCVLLRLLFFSERASECPSTAHSPRWRGGGGKPDGTHPPSIDLGGASGEAQCGRRSAHRSACCGELLTSTSQRTSVLAGDSSPATDCSPSGALAAAADRQRMSKLLRDLSAAGNGDDDVYLGYAPR